MREGKVGFHTPFYERIIPVLHSKKANKQNPSQKKENIVLLYEFIVHPNVVAVLSLCQKEHMRMWKVTEEESKDGQSHTTAFTEETPYPPPAKEVPFLTTH